MEDEERKKLSWCKELEEEGITCRRMSDYMDVSFMETRVLAQNQLVPAIVLRIGPLSRHG
jgi:hypothetical protein